MIFEYASDTPTGKLRWRSDGLGGRILEQEWQTQQFRGGVLINIRLEWRAVPMA